MKIPDLRKWEIGNGKSELRQLSSFPFPISHFPLPLLLFLAGCQYGTKPSTFPPAQGPAGALVAIRAIGDSTDRVGELFAADSSGVTVRAGSLVRVSWSRLHAMDIDKMGRSVDVRPGEVVTADKRRRIAALSRFPQGLSGDLLAAVLRELKQDSLIVIAQADLDSVARRAEQSAARYTSRSNAIADGYRRIGGDFPGMGEHWVNPNRIQTSDHIDASRPSFLSYALLGGQPRLLGVGFIVTSGADTADVNLPGWPHQWHEHSGLLGDESAGRSKRSLAASASRVFVLHIWTALPNPEGRYTPDNWTLPFARAGRVTPAGVDADAGRAFSLTVGGDDFLRGALSDLGVLRGEAEARADSAIASAKNRAALSFRGGPSPGIPSGARDLQLFGAGSAIEDSAVSTLRAIWADLDTTLQRVLGTDVADVMRPAHPVAAREMRSHAHGTPR
jgi:hypothetical protein